MKFTCLAENLAQKLSATAHIVSSKTSLPILAHLLLEAEAGQLTLSATNLEISLKTSLPVEVKEAGAVCLPARVFLDLVTNLPHGKIEVWEKGGNVQIKADKADSKINGLAATEFPKISTEGEPVVSLDPKAFIKDVQKVSFSAASDESRPVLTGVLLAASDNYLTMVGVDGFRLSERKIPVSLQGEFKEVVPAKALNEAARLLVSEETLSLLLSKEENQMVFRTAGFELTSRLLEGSFPDYQKIIPATFSSQARINVAEFKAALSIVSVFARDLGSLVKIALLPDESQMALSAASAEVGENKSLVFAKIEGEPAEVAFNARYLNDFLANLGSEEADFKVTGALSPGVFTPVGQEGYLHLIMPIRVQG